VDSLRIEPDGIRLCAGSQNLRFDYAVLAAPWHVVSAMLPQDAPGDRLRAELQALQPSPITGVHVWFDRQITDLDHAVLLDRTIQWMFHKSRIFGRKGNGSYVELVISSSKELVRKTREEILDMALRELAEFFPEAATARVLKSTVIKEVNATFAPVPGADRHRPAQRTSWPRLLLAGDWTQTGWPATMEGAVRSGYLAAGALAAAVGTPETFLVPDLRPRGFMRLFHT
jgi:zeta-carotene desaturase